eukprot:gene3773-5881_t
MARREESSSDNTSGAEAAEKRDAIDDEEDPEDAEIAKTMMQAHLVGVACLCMGMLFTSRFRKKYKTLASAGWLRGWGWGFCACGIVLISLSIMLLSQWPDEPRGVAIALMVLGFIAVICGPVILHNGNVRMIMFLSVESNAICSFPMGARVEVFDPHPNDPNEIDMVVGATGSVVGHLKGRVAVKFLNPNDRHRMQNVHQFLPKDGCMSADGLFLPCHLRRISRPLLPSQMGAGSATAPGSRSSTVDPDDL